MKRMGFVLKPQYDFIDAFTDIKKWDSYSYGCAGVGNKINSQMKYSAINSDFQELGPAWTAYRFNE